jgi:hypothetical protein
MKLLVTGIHTITMEQSLFNSLVIYNENLENLFRITRQNLMSLDQLHFTKEDFVLIQRKHTKQNRKSRKIKITLF